MAVASPTDAGVVRTVAELLSEAEALVRAGDVREARALAAAVAEVRPRDYNARRVLVQLAHQAKDSTAYEQAQALASEDPLDGAVMDIAAALLGAGPERTRLLGLRYEREPRPARETPYFEALGATPELTPRWLARIYFRAGLYSQAAAAFRGLTPEERDDATDLEEGIAYLWAERWDEVRRWAAEHAEDTRPLAHLLISIMFSQRNEPDSAMHRLARAFEHDADLRHFGSYVPESALEMLPARQGEQHVVVRGAGQSVTLAAYDDAAIAPREPATPAATRERPTVTKPAVTEEQPASAAPEAKPKEVDPVRLFLLEIARTRGVVRAFLLDGTGVIFNFPEANADPIEAKWLSVVARRVGELPQAVVAFDGAVNDWRVNSGGMTLHCMYDIKPGLSLAVIVVRSEFDAARFREVLADFTQEAA